MPAVIPFIPLIASGLGLAGDVLGGRKSARTQTEQTGGTSEYERSGTTEMTGRREGTSTTSFLDQPEYRGLRDLLLALSTERLASPSALPEGYLAEGIQNLNRGSGLAQQALENRLSAAGLSGSAVHGAGLGDIEQRRFGEIGRLENIEMPRLEREFRNQDLDFALRLFGMQRPTETTEYSDLLNNLTQTTESGENVSTGTGTTVFPGSPLGTGLGSAGELLAKLYGEGFFSKPRVGGPGRTSSSIYV